MSDDDESEDRARREHGERRSPLMLTVGLSHIILGTVGVLASATLILGGVILILTLNECVPQPEACLGDPLVCATPPPVCETGPLFDILPTLSHLPKFMVELVYPNDITILSWNAVTWEMLIGITRLVASFLLIIAGVRVLDVVPAGRRLSTAAIVAWTLLNVVEMYARGRGLVWFLAMTAYPMIVEILFIQKRWRSAFA